MKHFYRVSDASMLLSANSEQKTFLTHTFLKHKYLCACLLITHLLHQSTRNFQTLTPEMSCLNKQTQAVVKNEAWHHPLSLTGISLKAKVTGSSTQPASSGCQLHHTFRSFCIVDSSAAVDFKCYQTVQQTVKMSFFSVSFEALCGHLIYYMHD